MKAIRLLLILALCLPVVALPPTAHAAGMDLQVIFVGNEVVHLRGAVPESEDYDYIGKLYRDSTEINTYREGSFFSVDEGPTKGVTYIYTLVIYIWAEVEEPPGVRVWKWVEWGSKEVSATTGQVHGTIARNMTWAGGTWSCSWANVELNATLNIAPGTTVEGCLIRDWEEPGGVIMPIEGASLRDTSLSAPHSLTVRNSHLENTKLWAVGGIELSGNTGSAATPSEIYINSFTRDVAGGQVVVTGNQLPGSYLSLGSLYVSFSWPWSIVVENNTLGRFSAELAPGYYFSGPFSVVGNIFTERSPTWENIVIGRVAGPLNIERNAFGYIRLALRPLAGTLARSQKM